MGVTDSAAPPAGEQVRQTRRRRRTAGGASEPSVAESSLVTLAKRGANRMIHEFGAPSSDDDLVFGFFCECADPGCHTVVWFTPAAFDRASADPDWHALAPGHEVAAARPERS